jgi:NAD-dependent dihydropyrimidine dehydrogenase PreA subunit
MYIITIDEESCDGCGECVDICPSEVFSLENEKSKVTNLDECAGCESCVEVCPNSLITLTEE